MKAKAVKTPRMKCFAFSGLRERMLGDSYTAVESPLAYLVN